MIMMTSISRTLILFCCLFYSQWKISFFSDAWTLESPLPYSRRDTTRFFYRPIQTSNNDDVEMSQSRRSLLRLVPMVGITMLVSPATATAEIDPFAAMDDMLSSSGSTGLPTSFSSAISPTANASDKTSDDSKNPPPANASDMAAALQESKKRKSIDPRTHG